MSGRSVLAIVVACTASAAAAQPAFSSRIEAVRVDALVTDHGSPVVGLGRDDFEILDDGVPQQVDLISFEQIPLNVILTLDMSDSVAGDRLDHLRAAGRAALSALQRDDQSSLVTFSQIVTLRARLSGDTAAVRSALESASGAGETSLVDGIFTA